MNCRTKKCLLKNKKKKKFKRNSKKKQKKNLQTLVLTSTNILKKKNKGSIGSTAFQGSGYDLLFGLIYLSKKYSNFDIPISFSKSLGYLRDDYMNLGIRFECESYKTHKIFFPIKTEYLLNIVKKSKKRFCGTFIYLLWDCKSSGAHFNALLFDNKLKRVERFEPYTKFDNKNAISFKVITMFDKEFRKILKRYLNYTYIIPESICPSIGFQQKEETDLFNLDKNKKSPGNFILEDDPGGFCGAWTLYFMNMKLKYPDYDTKKLMDKIFITINKDKNSFRTFIRNYSNFIVKERKKILNSYQQYNNSNYMHTFLEKKFSSIINR